MKELSLNVLDITHNSITAGAKQIDLTLELTADRYFILPPWALVSSCK